MPGSPSIFSIFGRTEQTLFAKTLFFKPPSSCHSEARGFWIKMEPKGSFGTVQSTLSAAPRKVFLWNRGFHQNTTERMWILQSVITMPETWKPASSRQEQLIPRPFLSLEPFCLFSLNARDSFWEHITFFSSQNTCVYIVSPELTLKLGQSKNQKSLLHPVSCLFNKHESSHILSTRPAHRGRLRQEWRRNLALAFLCSRIFIYLCIYLWTYLFWERPPTCMVWPWTLQVILDGLDFLILLFPPSQCQTCITTLGFMYHGGLNPGLMHIMQVVYQLSYPGVLR